jgi:hypothetical protein
MTIPPDFTLHDGGPCPVDPDTMVSIITRMGIRNQRIFPASRYKWATRSPKTSGDIIAYKVEPKL